MKICYFVYREDNVLVYESQVLEYLKEFKHNFPIDSTTLLLFRHHSNFNRKKDVESKATNFVDRVKSFCSLPLISILQLKINSIRARRFVKKTFKNEEQIAVICRGELSTYIASRAFKNYKNAIILFDNRGLPVEESLLSHGKRFIHRLNRRVKRWAINKAKNSSDIYNFVTSNMRDYCINIYNYDIKKPFTIIPTLCLHNSFDTDIAYSVAFENGIQPNDLVFTYSGSLAAWQSEKELITIVEDILSMINNSKVFFLTKDKSQRLDLLKEEYPNRVISKSVSHSDMKYYLFLSDFGLIIRNCDIVNKVAAPTKIAEFVTYHVRTLYKGDIGIIDDLIKSGNKDCFIKIDENKAWIGKVIEQGKKYSCATKNLVFFDMKERQNETYIAFIEAFRKKKEMF